jgi:hypothetical protein
MTVQTQASQKEEEWITFKYLLILLIKDFMKSYMSKEQRIIQSSGPLED